MGAKIYSYKVCYSNAYYSNEYGFKGKKLFCDYIFH